jgi:phospholipase C
MAMGRETSPCRRRRNSRRTDVTILARVVHALFGMRARDVIMRPGAALIFGFSAAVLGCQLPPSLRADAAPQPEIDSGVLPEAGGSDVAGDDASPLDPFAARRASCAFGKGARVTQTLPISAEARAAIPIRHVVILMKENRSFDHLLGNLHIAGQPQVEAIPASFTNPDGHGAPVAPFPLDTTCVNQDPGHQWNEMHRQVHDGAMDGFVVNGADSTGGDGHFVMGTYAPKDLPFYYWLASTYAINDRHFPSVRSGTWPNRSFLLLGTADGVTCTYCGKPKPGTPSIFDIMDRGGVTWGVYTDSEPFDGTLGWDLQHPGVHSFLEFQKALKDGSLPSVAFVDSIGWLEDEHPTADVQVGENWTRIVYEAAVASPLWPTMALVWTYDEAGGFADHVPPPNTACIARPGVPDDARFFELGVRVPLVVISPYARANFASHVVEDHTAITRFIEAVFDLPALTGRDANSTALLEMFDFEHPPAFLHPPASPLAGTSGCHGQLVLQPDQPAYASGGTIVIRVSFRGVTSPQPKDRVALYRYPRAPADVPSEKNPLPPVAWGYVGGHGHTAEGAPASGEVTLDASITTAWPPTPGLWIAYYLPALASGEDGATPSASALIEILP